MSCSITVPCGALSTPEFGQFTFSTDGTTTTATFSCNLYATMSGERLVDCLTDGTWSHSAPSCGNIALFACLFDLILYVPTNDLSVMLGRVFLG